MKPAVLGVGVLPIPIQANKVTVSDPGGSFGGEPLTLQDVLDALAGGTIGGFLLNRRGELHVIEDLGSITGTETVDLNNANDFIAEVTGDVTISITGWTTGYTAITKLELTQDSTGGWLPTISGVTWLSNQPIAGGADTVQHIVVWSRDGGTTIWGAVIGGTGNDGMVPYQIDAGETFTVPIKKQALFNEPIVIDGSLVVSGMLLEVD